MSNRKRAALYMLIGATPGLLYSALIYVDGAMRWGWSWLFESIMRDWR